MSDQSNQDQQFQDTLDRIDSKAQALKADAAGANEKIGYVAESVHTFKKGYEEVLNRRSVQDDLRPTIDSGNQMASAIEHQLDDMRIRIDRLGYRIDSALPIFAITSAASVTSV